MKKNFWIPLFIAVVLGFISAQILYSTYQQNLKNSEYNAYFIQIGSYKNKESLPSELSSSNYLILEEEGEFHVYAGITTDLVNANKIKNIYHEEYKDTYIKPTIINNIEFVSNLEQYDILISEVDNEENLISINDVILSSYEEMVLEEQDSKNSE